MHTKSVLNMTKNALYNCVLIIIHLLMDIRSKAQNYQVEHISDDVIHESRIECAHPSQGFYQQVMEYNGIVDTRLSLKSRATIDILGDTQP